MYYVCGKDDTKEEDEEAEKNFAFIHNFTFFKVNKE